MIKYMYKKYTKNMEIAHVQYKVCLKLIIDIYKKYIYHHFIQYVTFMLRMIIKLLCMIHFNQGHASTRVMGDVLKSSFSKLKLTSYE